MKTDRIYKICVSIFFAAAILFFSGCQEKPEAEITKPDVESTDSAINLAFSKIENTKYINIFRAEYDNDAKQIKDDTTFNVGQIVPKSNVISAFHFSDFYVLFNTYYVYKVRYWNGTVYKTTDWSDPGRITLNNGIQGTDLRYTIPDGAFFSYDDSLKSLTLASSDGSAVEIADLTLDKDESYYATEGTRFYPALVFSYKDGDYKISKIFVLSDKKYTISSTGKAIDLRSLLSSEFFDKDITLDYIVGQRIFKQTSDNESTSEDGKTVYYIRKMWTLPVAIQIKDSEGTVMESLNIPSNTGDDGGDYSDTGIDKTTTLVDADYRCLSDEEKLY